jgi:murein L,D-transpeptidase YcbB/YkuD
MMKGIWHLKQKKARIIFGIAVICIFSMVFSIAGYEYMDERAFISYAENEKTNSINTPPEGQVSIVINVKERWLEVRDNGQPHKRYKIAVGKSKTPTPIGEWAVVWKDYNWGTGFGTRWMGLNVPWGIYGIHGTNKPWSIGQFASHGCIRMRNKDVEELFEWVPIGTSVKIEGEKVTVKRTLRPKSSGADVVVLQIKLRELGFFNDRADGLYGNKTEQAVKDYQQNKNLEVTGIASKEMLKEMGL